MAPEADDRQNHYRNKIVKRNESHEVIQTEDAASEQDECFGELVAAPPEEKANQWINATGYEQICEAFVVEWENISKFTQ